MNTTNPSLNHSLGTDWQSLGNLKLPVDMTIVDLINVSLAEILTPLNLSADFLSKIIKSAQDSAARAQQSNAAIKFGHIHISIFVPQKQIQSGKTWGFFHIERIGHHSKDDGSQDHTIDFYLYTEGE